LPDSKIHLVDSAITTIAMAYQVLAGERTAQQGAPLEMDKVVVETSGEIRGGVFNYQSPS